LKIFNDIQIQIDKPATQSIQDTGNSYCFTKDNFINFFCLDNFLNEQELDSLRSLENYIDFSYGRTIGQHSYSTPNKDDLRYCLTASIPCNDQTIWLYDKIADCVKKINSEHFHFDIDRIDEKIQYLKYESSNHKFDWHVDRWNGGYSRKFAVIIQLSTEEEYSGGDIELMFSPNPVKMSKKMGSLIIFPSYVLHRVTEVTSGTRRSLLCLIGGPQFR
jgi:PKHD-type hydroxylase